MKGFMKDLTDKQRKELLTRLVSVILSAIMCVAVGAVSFAWFASNNAANTSGLDVTVSTDSVDILVTRGTRYDPGYDGISGFKTKLGTLNYSLSAVSTSTAPFIAYELVNEFGMRDDGGVMRYFMQPGAYGTVSFYIRPKAGKDNTTVGFRFERGGFANGYENGTPAIIKVENVEINDLLKGHVLFFSERTGATYEDYKYDGLLQDGEFSYDMSLHEKCEEVGKTDCYKLTLYWEWPETFFEITDNISTTSPAVVKKYPQATADYITAHSDYFFKGAYNAGNDDSMSDAYNDGDQAIGDAVNYFVLYVSLISQQ